MVWRALRTDGHIIAWPHVALCGTAWEGKREEHAEGDEETHEDAGLNHHPHSASPHRDMSAEAGYSSGIQLDVCRAMQPDRALFCRSLLGTVKSATAHIMRKIQRKLMQEYTSCPERGGGLAYEVTSCTPR